MKIHCQSIAGANESWSVVRGCATARSGFTMIEIAISLGIIAIALVAIIGILPKGLNTQKENRDDTIMNQDGPFFLEAIRNGAQGLDHLTNYVEWIQISNAAGKTVYFDGRVAPPPALPVADFSNDSMRDGKSIIGLLSTPKMRPPDTNVTLVTAYVRSLSGAAVEQGKSARDFSFGYILTSEIVPVMTLHYLPADNSPENLARSNEVRQLTLSEGGNFGNYHDIRLTFRWPVKPAPSFEATGNRKTFRAVVAGSVVPDGDRFFIQPQHFVPAP